LAEPSLSVTASVPAAPTFERAWETKLGGDVGALVIAPAGEVLVNVGDTLSVLDPKDGRVVKSASACRARDGGLGFSDAGEIVLICTDSILVFSWPELARKRLVKRGGHSAAAVGRGRFATKETFGVGRVRIFSTETGEVVDWFDPPGRVDDLAFAPDGSRLAVGTAEGIYLRTVGARTGKLVFPVEHGLVRALDFAPDGRRLVAAVGAGVAVIEAESGAAVRTFGDRSSPAGAVFLAGGLLATSGYDGLAVWPANAAEPRVLGKELERLLARSTAGAFFCASGRDGALACFGRPDPAGDDRAFAATRPAALPSGAPPPEPVAAPPPPPTSAPAGYAIRWRKDVRAGWIGLTPDGTSLLTTNGALLEVRSLENGSSPRGTELCRGADGAIGFAKPDRLVSICEDRVEVLEWPSLAKKSSFQLEHDMNIGDVSSGRIVVDVEDTGRFAVYSVDTGKRVLEAKASAPLEALRLSPDGSRVAFSAKGEGTQIYDTKSRTARKLVEAVAGPELTFSPDGKKLLVRGASFSLREIDAATGAAGRVWESGWIHQAAYRKDDSIVIVGHDGLSLLSGSGEKTAPVDWVDRPGLAVAADGSTICGVSSFVGRSARGMTDEVVCFAKAP
jgi:WD40 repeat protein